MSLEKCPDSGFVKEQWTRINMWAMHNFEGLNPEDFRTSGKTLKDFCMNDGE
jgi:hypothetical protein